MPPAPPARGIASPAEFPTADRIRLSFESAVPGYVYVVQRASDGGWALLANERVEPGTAVEVPRNGALTYDQPGEKRIYAILTSVPDPELERLDAAAIERRTGGASAVTLTIR